MCRSTVDIHSATAEIRRGIRKRKKEDKNIMSASATQVAIINLVNRWLETFAASENISINQSINQFIKIHQTCMHQYK